MPLVFLLGGARSGKSRLAVSLAGASHAPVTVVATAEARDEEMRERIAAHRAERPAGWRTIEAPLRLELALAEVPRDETVIVDCLSLWAANMLEQGSTPADIMAAAERTAALAAARSGLTVSISNEVGMGVVPATPLGRSYRDLLGSVNRIWAGAASRAALVVAGRALPLLDADALDVPACGAGS
jgi:adenosylcobinamide kinase / adenosylcobinamide-phosphate guanylyltransferase